MDIIVKNIKKIINNIGKKDHNHGQEMINLIMDGIEFANTKTFSKSKFLKRLQELNENVIEGGFPNYECFPSTITIHLRNPANPRDDEVIMVPATKFFDYGCTVKSYNPVQMADHVTKFRREYVRNYAVLKDETNKAKAKLNMLRKPTALMAQKYILETYGIKVEPTIALTAEYIAFPVCNIDTQWQIPVRASETEIKKIIDNTVKEWRQLTKFKYIHHERALIESVKQTLAFLEEHKHATAISANITG